MDHGLLNLSSQIKLSSGADTAADMFLLYYQTRQSRLETLGEAKINIDLKTVFEANKLTLEIRMSDSGVGFDYQSTVAALKNELDHHKPCHRGIALIHQLCEKMEFEDGGRTILLTFLL